MKNLGKFTEPHGADPFLCTKACVVSIFKLKFKDLTKQGRLAMGLPGHTIRSSMDPRSTIQGFVKFSIKIFWVNPTRKPHFNTQPLFFSLFLTLSMCTYLFCLKNSHSISLISYFSFFKYYYKLKGMPFH